MNVLLRILPSAVQMCSPELLVEVSLVVGRATLVTQFPSGLPFAVCVVSE